MTEAAIFDFATSSGRSSTLRFATAGADASIARADWTPKSLRSTTCTRSRAEGHTTRGTSSRPADRAIA